MKKIILTSLLALSVAACDKVPAGNVGIKVYLLGGNKGVDTEELGVGRYWIGFNEDLYIFPTFTQNYVWTASKSEGSPEDESISFQTIEGLTVNADIGISYRIQADKASVIFQKYRRGVEEITDIFIRNMVRDALVIEASQRPIEAVYGAGKAEIIAAVEARVREQLVEAGIVVERIYWIGELRLPESVTAAIDAKIQATQRAAQRRNEIDEEKAEAQKRREAAKGIADSLLIEAEAKARANKIIAQSLTKDLVTYTAIEKWSGDLPKFTGDSAIPFIQVQE